MTRFVERAEQLVGDVKKRLPKVNVERVRKTVKKELSGVEVVENEAGLVRFERGRTYYEGEIDGVRIIADVSTREGKFEIRVSRPTGEVFTDGSPVRERPVGVYGHRTWGLGEIPAKLHKTTSY
ncbi:hypothetical protein A3A76_05540 [Candidatus Woesebacteria bacterium RIFCSPLOWO2_01_FULL_39_23]|uniref:Uncharacterized protein n=1 Tax=Candidatus Woesebacteria bacterium RIFCSPHIGHO2_01_FULL_40_22 TaxID=1802499 RepID=A0A1F7YKW1_9BACT|nr:MAG: hypothetical protein A2141_03770 [Candidatus Woesebacteria bacterium RBG_16_40_11]OGM27917.1 MAG: hypothetical protein A2628_03465 [Candidatus Woesebacteria bacterium RIFCSPHIGHO2_01_FULL_40_22]OGM37521.1 MAG: hypothetical protein A3E41_01685 [Candidatus Woesebacteria bacterium RIFCSPHIGHO2_12_FULL_38_9]OGM61673.1 MAG: hypothetical protein A3A76_05540 [Candidatus Woesebacteria bacterium RIFCSPLOWO2_01_FULL_39_23]